jgi:hemolysin activation/secretion protein
MGVKYRKFSYLASWIILLGQLNAGQASAEISFSADDLKDIETIAGNTEELPEQLLDIAQVSDPNQDRFPQSLPEPELTDPEEEEPVLPPSETETEPISPDVSEAEVEVTAIEVTGSTIYTSEDWDEFTQPLEGRTVTVAELRAAADAITRLYQNEGYLTSRAILPQQEVVDGVVQIQVIEGSLEEIQIEGNRRVKSDYISSRAELGVDTPLNVFKLEDQLRLLRQNPLFDTLSATLQPGTDLGQSVLAIEVDEANPFYGFASFDNYSPPSLGSERLGIGAGYRNLTGYGDNLFASYFVSTTGGSDLIDAFYQIPVNPMEGTIQLRTQFNWTEITEDPFDDLGIEGDSQFYELSFRQPLIRTPTEEFALSLAFSFEDGQTFTFDDIPTPFGFGPDEDGVSRTSVFRFGQDYIRRDAKGAWILRSLFNVGTTLFDATSNPEPIPDSAFFSWNGQVQRVQRLSDNHTLVAQASVQLTPDPLLPSEQFVIGGFYSVRGYRESARNGDNGLRLSVEDRITLSRNDRGESILLLIPFADIGYVWNQGDNPNDLPDQKFLASIGTGILYEPVRNLNLRLDYGLPLVDLDDRGDNLQDDGFHFSVNYQF